MQRPICLLCVFSILFSCLIPTTFAKSNEKDIQFFNSKEQKRRVLLIFKFIDHKPKNTSMPTVDESGRQIKYKVWNEKEKEQVIYELETILSAYPGLVLNASSGQSINLFRVDDYIFNDCHRNKLCSLATADSKLKSISITNNYFHHTERNSPSGLYQTLIHELVHLADCGGRYSYSKEWITVAYPKIREANVFWRAGTLNKVREVAKSNNLPTAYATKNMRECLAECACTYLTRGYPDTEIAKVFKEKIEPRLLNPSIDECLWSIKFINGEKSFKEGNLEKAKQQFQKALKINPKVPELLDYYADILHRENDYKNSLLLSNQSIETLNKFVKKERYYWATKYLKNHATRLTKSDRFIDAIPIYDKLIKAGYDKHYIDRALCYEKMGKLYEAAKDYSNNLELGAGMAAFGIIKRSPETNTYKTIQFLNRAIEKNPKSTSLKLSRANCLTFADFYKTEDNREKLFQLGKEDYEYVLSLPDSELSIFDGNPDREELELCFAEFCYRFKKFQSAINHCDQVLNINPESHQIYGIKFGALTNLNQDKKAEKLYQRFKKMIQNNSNSVIHRNARSFYFRFLDYDFYKCKKEKMLELSLKDLKKILAMPDKELEKSTYKKRLYIERECAELSFILGKYKSALKHCKKMLLLDSKCYACRAKVLQIGSYERLNQKKKAIAYFKKFKKSYNL